MRLLLVISAFLFTTISMVAQAEHDLPFQVNINYEPLSISLEQLHSANNLSDLNRMFRPEWIKEYLSVEISTVQNDKVVSVLGHSNILNQEQKDFLKGLSFPAPITVTMNYIPDNTLKDNPPRTEIFTFSIHPTESASYIGGEEKLINYLKENAIAFIDDTIFQGYDLAVVNFTINEEGQVVDAYIYQSSKDEQTDKLLYETTCNMSDWIPAQHSSGVKVRQEFAWTVGNHENCMINLLNTINNKY